MYFSELKLVEKEDEHGKSKQYPMTQEGYEN